MRIAVWYNLPSGGAKRALFDQVRGLVARGHHVEVWRPAGAKKGGFADLRTIVEEHEVPLDPILADEGGYFTKVSRHFRRFEAFMRAMVAHSEACARGIEAGGFDLLYAHNDLLFNSPFIGRMVDLPKALYLQEPQRILYEALPRLPWAAPEETTALRLDKRVKRGILDAHDLKMLRVQVREETRNAKAFDRVLVNSLYSRESVLRAYGREGLDVRVCYLGIDLDRFANLHLPRERTVVGLGAVSPPKNLEGAIRAVGAIGRDRPPLLWIGNFVEEPYHAESLALAAELGVDLRIELLLSDAELRERLCRAGTMVYAPFLEPFGYAPLEANACGLAVAAVAEGGVRETVVDGVNGLLAAPEPAALGAAVERVLDDPDLGERAEGYVRERWGLERSIDEVERNLREVAGRT